MAIPVNLVHVWRKLSSRIGNEENMPGLNLHVNVQDANTICSNLVSFSQEEPTDILGLVNDKTATLWDLVVAIGLYGSTAGKSGMSNSLEIMALVLSQAEQQRLSDELTAAGHDPAECPGCQSEKR